MDKKGFFDLEYVQDRKRIKIIITYISGDRLHFRDDVSVRVVAPEKSFILRRPPNVRDLSISFADRLNDVDQAQMIELLEYSLLRSPYYLLGMPIVDLLAKKGTLIKNVTEKKDLEKNLTQIQVRFDPHPKLKEWFDRCDGQFLFEPMSFWALRSFDIKYLKKNEHQLGLRVTGSVDYDEASKDVPTLKSLQHNIFDAQGRLMNGYHVEVKSIEFGHASPEEFTLRGCGVPDIKESRRRWPAAFYWANGVFLLALALIFVLRRCKAKRQQAAG